MKIFFVLFYAMISLSLSAQPPGANYEESKVPEYTLPDPLLLANRNKVSNLKDWEKQRQVIYSMFEKEVYGVSPAWEGETVISKISPPEKVFGGKAVRKQLLITLSKNNKEVNIPILLYLPVSNKPVPVFLGYNFYGNQTITKEPDVFISPSWVRNNTEFGILENKGTEASRGKRISRWPVEEIISRGYALATIYYGDVDPDFDDGFKNGVHGLFDQQRDSTSWGSIAAWAWGLSRAIDYLVTDSDIDGKKISVLGHSRLGKAALWAGASDSRIAIVISNNSGCGGAALSRRKFGETVATINSAFPHWFCNNFKKYNHKEETLPIDQHELIALIAPRPVYVASATEDLWADPRGEFLAAKNAGPVYQLFGFVGLNVDEMPRPEKPVGNFIGYHLRTGKHNITDYDWEQYLNFADKHYSTGTSKK